MGFIESFHFKKKPMTFVPLSVSYSQHGVWSPKPYDTRDGS
jgi:hypothetical protein